VTFVPNLSSTSFFLMNTDVRLWTIIRAPHVNSFAKLVPSPPHIFTGVTPTDDYCSLVDRRWRDFIH
jgi:hypothetical protein